MKPLFLFALLTLGGCTANKPIQVAVNPTSASNPAKTTQSKPAATPEPPVTEVRAVEFSRDARWLAVGTLRRAEEIDGRVSMRDVATNKVAKLWTLKGGVRALALSPDGETVAVMGAFGKLSVWDWKSARLLHTEVLAATDDNGGGDKASLAFAPNGRLLATGTGGVRLLSTRDWKTQKKLSFDIGNSFLDFIGFSPDSQSLVAAFEDIGPAYLLVNLKSGRRRVLQRGDALASPVFSPDGMLFVGSSHEQSIVLNLRRSKFKQIFKSEKFQPQAFSPDSRFVVGVASEGEDEGQVEVWSVATGKRVRQFKETTRRVVYLDAKTLLAGDENGARRLGMN